MVLECKKLLFRREAIILILLTLVCSAFLLKRINNFSPDIPEMEHIYQELVLQYRMPSSQALPLLEKEYERLKQEVDELEKRNDPESRQKLQEVKNWYNATGTVLQSAQHIEANNQNKITMLNTLKWQMESAPTAYIRKDLQQAYDSYNRAYVYHIYPMELYQGVGHCEDVFFSCLYLIFLLAFLGSLFAIENESGMYQILYSCKRGREGIFRRKLFAAILCIVVTAFFFTVVTFLGGWLRSGLNLCLINEPIQSLNQLALCPFELSILEYVLVLYFMRVLVGILVLSLICLFSTFLKKGITVFSGSSVVILVLSLLALTDKFPEGVSNYARKFGGCFLLQLQKYLTTYESVNVFGTPVMGLYLAIGCTLTVSFFMIMLAYTIFTRELKGGRKHA